MVEIHEAKIILEKNFSFHLEKEKKGLIDALGLTLACDILAPINVPPFDRSPFDGYALTSCSSGDIFQVIGKIYAGDVFQGSINRGEAVRIMTGAPVPPGTETVIKQEDIQLLENGSIMTLKSLSAGENIAFMGEDIKKDTVLIPKDTFIDSNCIGSIASLGITEVEVYKKLTVGIISTGSELTELGSDLAPGKIYNSNSYILAARLLELGFNPLIMSPVKDEKSHLKESILKAIDECNILITTGGVSVGEKDLVPDILDSAGAERIFKKMNIRPGTQIVVSKLKGKPVFSLSGNPSAALVSFDILVRDFLANASKNEKIKTLWTTAVFSGKSSKDIPMIKALRGIAFCSEKEITVKPVDRTQNSGAVSSSLNSNCLILFPKNKITNSGDTVDVVLLDYLRSCHD